MIIEKNTTIPTRKTKAFTTVEHNQRQVRIHVLQGEGLLASMNKSLAVFDLVGIEPAPAGVPQIDVTFEINADGLVKVSARDKATGLEQKIEVRPSSGLSPAEIDEPASRGRRDGKSPRRDRMAKRDYYEVLGVPAGRLGRGDQESLPPDGAEAPSRTAIPATRRPRKSSRRRPKPTASWPTRRRGPSTTASATTA